MKLTLILLAVCCVYVSVTHQQQIWQRRYPLSLYNYNYNSYYDDDLPQLSRNYLMRHQAHPIFAVKNNFMQPYSPQNHYSSPEYQVLMVI